MVGREYANHRYRFSFNGKEKDAEIPGNNYDYGYRIYNARLGRFLSVDPLSSEYAWYTPYQFAGNKPTISIDLDGLEEIEIQIGVQQWTDKKLQDEAKILAESNEQALLAMQQKAYNKVLSELDEIVAKHFDPKKNAAPNWSGITQDVSTYFWNSDAKSSLGVWNSYYNYGDDGATSDDLSKKIDSDVKWLVNNHFYAASAGTEFYYEYIKLINEAKDPNKKAALMCERELKAKQKWQTLFKGVQLGIAELFLSVSALSSGLPNGRKLNSPRISVGESKIVVHFGQTENQVYHAFRHTDELGLTRSLVKSSVESHFKTVASQVVENQAFNQTIQVGNYRLQYTAYKLSDGSFNIGRIHAVD